MTACRVPHLRRPLRHVPSGFTLVETLVTISIIAVLAVVGFSITQRVRKSGQLVRELNAGRNLSAAVALHAADKNDLLPYGVDGSLPSLSLEGSGIRKGLVSGAEAHRYPFRLAPYFGFKFDGTTVIDRSLKYTLDKRDTYMISLLPAMGMNAYGVGGYIEEGGTLPIDGSIRRMSQAVAPEKMIAFCSARLSYPGLGGIAPGFHMVTPPKTPGGDWAGNYDEKDASSWGNVDLRYDNKSVVAFLDGSASTLSREALNDMRHWNNEAARLNDPNHRPVVSSGGRGR